MAASLLLVPIAPEAQVELTAKLNHDLSFSWDTLHVPQEVQARLSQLGFYDSDVWSNAEDSKGAVRRFITTEVGIKKEGNELYRSIVGRLLAPWQPGDIQGAKRKQEEADQLMGGSVSSNASKIPPRAAERLQQSAPEVGRVRGAVHRAGRRQQKHTSKTGSWWHPSGRQWLPRRRSTISPSLTTPSWRQTARSESRPVCVLRSPSRKMLRSFGSVSRCTASWKFIRLKYPTKPVFLKLSVGD